MGGDTDEFKSKILKSRVSNEPPLEATEEEANFLDDCFGENVDVESYLDEAKAQLKRDEARMVNKNVASKQRALRMTKKPLFKETVIGVLQHRGMNSLWLRIAFWVNKLVSMIHRPHKERWDREPVNF